MSALTIAALSATGGAAVTAIGAFLRSYYQRVSVLQDERRLRTFERHQEKYEAIFVAARSVQGALHDYSLIESRTQDRSEVFLRQLLVVLRNHVLEYCAAVDWRHNAGMAYLDTRLEEQCLHVRDLLVCWISAPRVSPGIVIIARTGERTRQLSRAAVMGLRPGDYDELRIERRTMVPLSSDDRRLAERVQDTLADLLIRLKTVMAY